MAGLSLLLFNQIVLFATALAVVKYIYRITYHPLSCFPGPKLAALTNFYAASYDLSGKDSLVKHLKSLHDKYGPIVRVRPNELHIFDWEAYHTVFKHGSDFDRPAEFYNNPEVDGSVLNIPSARVAKPHRDLFVQAFSKASINNLEPLIHEKQAIFLDKLGDVAKENKTVDLDMALNCLTGETAMHYCYQMSLGLLDAQYFRPSLIVDMHEFGQVVPFLWYFPSIGTILNNIVSNLPDSVSKTYFPAAASMKAMGAQCEALITLLSKASPTSNEVQSSIFRQALNPNKEKGQYVASKRELIADAVLMFLAGTDTTAHALTFGIWEMIKQPQIWNRLRQEVRRVVPNTNDDLSLRSLETLPYLRAVTKESIRFSMGTSARLPRVVPQGGTPTILCNRPIPAGTRVSFSHYVYNNDPAIFQDPYTFNPDRWLGPDVNTLESHMISFSRGSRNCIGMNLAYAELHTTLASLVSKFDVINDGTRDEDMDWTDCFTPRFKGHLKVKLRVAE